MLSSLCIFSFLISAVSSFSDVGGGNRSEVWSERKRCCVWVIISLSHHTAWQFTSWHGAQSKRQHRIPGSVGPAAFTMWLRRKVLYNALQCGSLASLTPFSKKPTLQRKVTCQKHDNHSRREINNLCLNPALTGNVPILVSNNWTEWLDLMTPHPSPSTFDPNTCDGC